MRLKVPGSPVQLRVWPVGVAAVTAAAVVTAVVTCVSVAAWLHSASPTLPLGDSRVAMSSSSPSPPAAPRGRSHVPIKAARGKKNRVDTSEVRRYVHLDLKGAPPRLAFLQELLPWLKAMGADGILLEYEDMFPYEGRLAAACSGDAYSRDDVRTLLALARTLSLDVVPLIQTFGHLEFVLKLRRFRHLREMDVMPNFLNARHNESMSLVREMLDQILALHGSDVTHVHIGADEVAVIGISPEVKATIMQNGESRADVFLRHVGAVATYVTSRWPGVQVLMWDDMLRDMSVEDLKESGLPGLVQPVVWAYKTNVTQRVGPSAWLTYSQVFTDIWISSSYKGSTGSWQYLPDPAIHIQNHLSWLRILDFLHSTYPKLRVRAIAFTGWARYDHFSALTELLPVAMPTLVTCLEVFKTGGRDSDIIRKMSLRMECENEFYSIRTQSYLKNSRCTFPGHELFEVMLSYKETLDKFSLYFDQLRGRSRGYLNQYALARGEVDHYRLATTVIRPAKTIRALLNKFRTAVEPLLARYFTQASSREWLEEYVASVHDWLDELEERTAVAVARGPRTWPARPLPNNGDDIINIKHVVDM